MILLHAPTDGKLLFCREITPKNSDFLIPYADFFENSAPVLRLCIAPCDGRICSPAPGILTLDAPPVLCIDGKHRTLLWLHGADEVPLSPSALGLLSLATAGAPLRRGQLLGFLSPSALGKEVRLSLAIGLPKGTQVQCRSGRLTAQRPLLWHTGTARVEPTRKKTL